MQNKYKVLDLFSGAGGMSEGFLQAGFHVPCATDYSKEASETYINRHIQLGYSINYHSGDIRDLTRNKKKLKELIGENNIDVVVGGPPCQGFSLSGQRLEDDIRNTLFLEYLKIVKIVKPKYFVMENVAGLLSYQFRTIKGLDKTVYENVYPQEVIKQEALKMGYLVRCEILNAKHYGVPQNRPRVIFIGHKIRRYRGGTIKNIVSQPNFPQPILDVVSVEDALSDLNFLKNGEIKSEYIKNIKLSTYQKKLREGLTPTINGTPFTCNTLYNHQASKHLEKTIARFKLLNPGETINEMLERISNDLREEFHTKKNRCTKLSRDSVSPTVLTLPDDIIHYDEENPRILTVRELARLQSFDDSFEFKGKRTTGGDRRKFETPQYTQVGNAVPPLFAKAIAIEIKKSLDETKALYNK